jgi:hypothetical protein
MVLFKSLIAAPLNQPFTRRGWTVGTSFFTSSRMLWFIRVHSWLKRMQKSRFFVSGKQNFFQSSLKVESCKQIASAAQRRSIGTAIIINSWF